MRHLLYLLICSVFIGCGMQAAPADETQAVAQAVENLRTALIEGDRSRLEQLVLPQLSYGHSSGTIEDRAAFVEAIASGRVDFISLEQAEQTIEVVGNTAVVRHKLTGEYTNQGTPATINLGVLLIWQKQEGQWKLLARQAYRL